MAYTHVDKKEVTVLTGLDLSVAFDTVDHEILLEGLQTVFGVEGMARTWLRSYVDGRTQYGQHQSTAIYSIPARGRCPSGPRSVLGHSTSVSV